MTKRILIIAGEASGDLQAADLVQQIKQFDPTAIIFGVGGPKMRAAGVEIIEDSAKIAVVGATEIISHFPIIYKTFRKLEKILYDNPPDLVILVDYPGFNLRFAKAAKRANIKVFYYISPQIWAWHQSRVNIIKKYVDLMAVVFPFEVDFYRKAGAVAKFVGHPLVKNAKPSMPKEQSQRFFNINVEHRTVALLPGSRKSEIKYLLPNIIHAAKILKARHAPIQFVLPLAPTLTKEHLTPYLAGIDFEIKITTEHTYDVISLADAAIVASGTAILETALLGIPMVLIYKVAPLTHIIGRMVMQVPYLGICNIIANQEIVKELWQYQVKPHSIANEITRILTDKNYRTTMQQELAKIKNSLDNTTSENAAKLVLNLLT